MKTCTKCGVTRDSSGFDKNKSNKDGLGSHCKQCMASYRRLHRQRISEYKHSYRKSNCERIARYLANYRKSYRYTPAGFTSRKWGAINRRTVNGSCPDWNNPSISYSYLDKGICLEITKEELRQIVDRDWHIIEDLWNQGKTPSIDRINPNGHYSVDNIRFIDLIENCRRTGRA